MYIPMRIYGYLYYPPMRWGWCARGYYEGVPMHAAGRFAVAPPPCSVTPTSPPFHLVVYEGVLARERLRVPLQSPICPSEAF